MGLRIIVDSPIDYKENLFGTVLKEHSTKLVIKLSEPIAVGNFKSNIVLLKTTDKKETFHSLKLYYAVFINASLINDRHDVILKNVFTGTVSLD